MNFFFVSNNFFEGVLLPKTQATRFKSLTAGPMPRWHAKSALISYPYAIRTVFAQPSQVIAPVQCMPQVLASKWSFTPSYSTISVIDSKVCCNPAGIRIRNASERSGSVTWIAAAGSRTAAPGRPWRRAMPGHGLQFPSFIVFTHPSLIHI